MSPVVTTWAIEALLASTLLMAFVLLVRRPAQRAIGPQLAYWLWALPALRMAMPPLPASWRENVAAPVAAASETVLIYITPAADAAAADPLVAPFPWLIVVALAWGLGALAFFAWHGAAHVAYVRRIVSPPARHERLADGTTLVESEEAIGPVAFGVLKRFVAVPQDFADRYDADERRLALAHELGHHARGDLIANWIALALLAVHWFNPLAWVAYRKFRTDQELANDARVLASLPRIERHAYACAILKAAHGRAITAACHLHTIEDLKGRLKMLKETRKSRGVLLAGATGIAALTVAGLGLTGSTAAAEKLRSVAVEQAPLLAVAAPATEPAATVVAAGAAPAAAQAAPAVKADKAKRITRVTVVRDGKAEDYRGEAAEAYLAAHPEMLPPAPPAPPAPGAVAVPPAPPAPPAVLAANGTFRSVYIREGGERGEVLTRFRVPEVRSRRCGGASDKTSYVIHARSGDPRKIVVCTDRIEAMSQRGTATAIRSVTVAERGAAVAARGAEMAVRGAQVAARGEQIERQALAAALQNLRNARVNVIANVPAEGRAEALAAIDESIDELERQRD